MAEGKLNQKVNLSHHNNSFQQKTKIVVPYMMGHWSTIQITLTNGWGYFQVLMIFLVQIFLQKKHLHMSWRMFQQVVVTLLPITPKIKITIQVLPSFNLSGYVQQTSPTIVSFDHCVIEGCTFPTLRHDQLYYHRKIHGKACPYFSTTCELSKMVFFFLNKNLDLYCSTL